MTDRIDTDHHYAEYDKPAWTVYLKRTDEKVDEWLFVDEDDVRRRLERLDADAQPTLFD